MERGPLIPPVEEIEFRDSHRLVPAQYRPKSVFRGVSGDLDLDLLDEIAFATDTSELPSPAGLTGISQRELVFGIPNAEIVRNTFRYAGEGGRFHDRSRGAWYAADALHVSIYEVGYHLGRRLQTARGIEVEGRSYEYDDWQADFHAEFHRLDRSRKFQKYLKSEPVPECYAEGQALARLLLGKGANGIIYPSVRDEEGLCIVCFRPALVYRPRLAESYTLTISLEDSGAFEIRHSKK